MVYLWTIYFHDGLNNPFGERTLLHYIHSRIKVATCLSRKATVICVGRATPKEILVCYVYSIQKFHPTLLINSASNKFWWWFKSFLFKVVLYYSDNLSNLHAKQNWRMAKEPLDPYWFVNINHKLIRSKLKQNERGIQLSVQAMPNQHSWMLPQNQTSSVMYANTDCMINIMWATSFPSYPWQQEQGIDRFGRQLAFALYKSNLTTQSLE